MDEATRDSTLLFLGLIIAILIIAKVFAPSWMGIAIIVSAFLLLAMICGLTDSDNINSSKKVNNAPSKKQKKHKDQMWARRNIRQNFKRKR
jgi:hypothetical protein